MKKRNILSCLAVLVLVALGIARLNVLLELLAQLGVGHPVLLAVQLPDPVHAQEDDQRQEQEAQIGCAVLLCQDSPSCGGFKYLRFGVDLGLQYADVGHVAVLLAVVQAVALPTGQARREPFYWI